MKKKEDISFREAFTELELIVQEFERGDFDVEVSLKKFERGLELAAFCKERLSGIEQSVKLIKQKFGNLITDEQ